MLRGSLSSTDIGFVKIAVCFSERVSSTSSVPLTSDSTTTGFSFIPKENFIGNINLKEDKILTKEKHLIITGLNPNWPSPDSLIRPYFVKSDELEKLEPKCDIFDITKA